MVLRYPPIDRFHLETAMVALFTLEYLLRVFAHSDSLRMLGRFFLCKYIIISHSPKIVTKNSHTIQAPLSIIDFIAIIPFYIELLAQRDTVRGYSILALSWLWILIEESRLRPRRMNFDSLSFAYFGCCGYSRHTSTRMLSS